MRDKFQPRYSAPSSVDDNWRHIRVGGKNECIHIGGGSVLPNCVGYAWGRWIELLGKRPNLHKGNAENWWLQTDGYERSEFPKLGAVICWRKGKVMDGSDGAGHVAVVENILADGSVVTSNSNYAGTRFYMRTIKPPYNIGTTYMFQGFILPPIEFDPYDTDIDFRKSLETLANEVLKGLWGNGADRRAKLLAAGYNATEVQKKVNELIAAKVVIPRKTIDELAQEVIMGKWGSGYSRHVMLSRAGYNYVEVQKRVNQILAITKRKKSVDTIAREVIQGKWGNGLARKRALIAAGYDYNAVQIKVNRFLK
jgi:hypothetical protein